MVDLQFLGFAMVWKQYTWSIDHTLNVKLWSFPRLMIMQLMPPMILCWSRSCNCGAAVSLVIRRVNNLPPVILKSHQKRDWYPCLCRIFIIKRAILVQCFPHSSGSVRFQLCRLMVKNHMTILFFTSSIVFNKSHYLFNTLLLICYFKICFLSDAFAQSRQM